MDGRFVKVTRIIDCPVCGQRQSTPLTRDHVIPNWFVKRVHMLGIGVPRPDNKFTKMCQKCNLAKGGEMDWRDPVVRDFMQEIARRITLKLSQPTT